MLNRNSSKHPYRLVKTKLLFFISLIVTALTILIVSISGAKGQWSLFQDSLVITSILFATFFVFITVGLYNGFKLKDDLGKLTDKIKIEFPDNPIDIDVLHITTSADDLTGFLLGILLWLVVTIVFGFLLWLFGAVLWIIVLLFGAMLYWIFFRALRLVFKHSAKCKDSLGKSILYGLTFSILYNIWIYAIILIAHYLKINFFIPSI